MATSFRARSWGGTALKGKFREGQRVAGFPYPVRVCDACRRGDLTFGACTGAVGIGLGQHHGAYAELVTIGGNGRIFSPDIVSLPEGALVEPLAVGLHAVDMAKMGARRDRAGGRRRAVGLRRHAVGAVPGARHVIVGEMAGNRRATAARFGATDAIDLKNR